MTLPSRLVPVISTPTFVVPILNMPVFLDGSMIMFVALDDMVTTRAKFTYMPGMSFRLEVTNRCFEYRSVYRSFYYQ